MRLCIVPMKPLARAKLRLAPLLSPQDRRRLSLAMLADVVGAARGFDAVWVLHSDAEAAAVARAGGADPRPDPTPAGGLNASLTAATAAARDAGATGALIVSADLPAVTAGDLEALTATGDGVALAPDRAGRGTNVLWRQPADAIPVSYGDQSRDAHEQLARARGLAFQIVSRPRLALDVDTAADLRALEHLEPGERTRAILAELGARDHR